MSGRGRGGMGAGVVTAFLALGCCLLAAPTADADFDDLLDTVLGAATAGDVVDLGDVAADPGAFDPHAVLDDPLAQLDQLFHDAPGSDDGAPDTTAGAPTDGTPDTTGSAEHGEGSSSNNLPSLPKFSMPSTGSGSGGSGGGSGGSGGPAGSAKPKANSGATSATNGIPAAAP